MKNEGEFPNLLAPIRLSSVSLRNRMVMPPMGANFAADHGFVSQRGIDYYEARAAGGVGLVIVEVGCVDYPRGRAITNQIAIDDDKYLAGLTELATAIKRHGAVAMIQAHHAGREARVHSLGLSPVGPSSRPSILPNALAVQPLSLDDILALEERFAEGAARVQRAGFDGVEIHAAHTYLLSQFLSPLCNDRTDQYGGSIANRARMTLETVRRVRERVGTGFLLSVRLSEEPIPGGFSIEDLCIVARMLEQAGTDLISVSCGGHAVPKPLVIAPACYPPGYQLHLPERVKQVVTVPVIGVGRLNMPEIAEAALRDGKCDLVALGRTLVADPEFPNKVAQGHPEDIRPCVACMECFQTGVRGVDFACANNPSVGHERDMAIQPAVKPKKVFVVGGGVAGMEAARTAALRGHDVTLFERSEVLGGQLIDAALPPHKRDLSLLHAYYLTQIQKAGVAVLTGTAVEPAAVIAGRPDAVIVATGSRPRIPEIPGIHRGNVAMAVDVLTGKVATGKRVVVVGGELVGCETAEFLAVRGRHVTIVRRSEKKLASGMIPVVRRPLLDRLETLNVHWLRGASYVEINERGLLITTTEGNPELLEADTVVIAAGFTSSRDLASGLEGKVAFVRTVGDAVEPRGFLEAIHDGMAAGMAV